MDSFVPIVVQLGLAIALALMIFAVSHLFGQRGRPGKIKDTPYECGIASKAEPLGPFPIKFYRVVLLFIVMDVSLVFLVPWALSFKASLPAGPTLLLTGALFLAQLGLAVYYPMKLKFLEWEE